MEPAVASSPHPWRWIPTLYFAQGIPYVAVMTLSVVLYKNLHVSNADIALYTSWLYLPWVIKPLWSPVVELYRTKRFWIVALQLAMAAALALVALVLPGSFFFVGTLAVFWLLAFSSATHDIAADGFYLLALAPHQQAAFVGVRSTFYRLAMIAGQGGLVWLAGVWQDRTGNPALAWSWVFALAAGFFVVVAIHHGVFLPRPERATTAATPTRSSFGTDYLEVFAAFFRKKGIVPILAFLLLYRFAEAQLLKLVPPFLLDARSVGGLGLSTQHVGLIYGTIGVIALTAGGLVGGAVIARFGLKRLLWPMLLSMYTPNLVFIFLALAQPTNLAVVGGALAVEQFGYGFGFTAYMVYMMMVADGEHRTAHYALCTGFMALGMMLPGMGAGWLQEKLGYVNFFIWVCIATIPSFLATAAIKVDSAFGRKTSA
ncbi:MFS transporter [Opitutus terrae]|uniref:Major facilitator superfamily MFS_1 n=1 Tax=Opitutus terrae (strain DSM 11246 / JCM 15787 / PB90-1) TaxID=452637 RepID=B1ZXM9_OPITP|nr:MFS transporter [Opitutus terrae]ACB74251.1 major facilitator superfamily MFS_1 [Opitutus terrae PB90-1]